MNKTEITTALNSFISAIGKVTKTRHTSANALIVDEIYNQPVVDDQISETFTTKAGSIFIYFLTIIKVGNVAQIRVKITNTTGNSQNAQSVFSFKENQYKPKPVFVTKIRAFSSGGAVLNFTLTNAGLVFDGNNFPTNVEYEFNFQTYITQN